MSSIILTFQGAIVIFFVSLIAFYTKTCKFYWFLQFARFQVKHFKKSARGAVAQLVRAPV